MAKSSFLFFVLLLSIVHGNDNANELKKIRKDYKSHVGSQNLVANEFDKNYIINIPQPRGNLTSCKAFQLVNRKTDDEYCKKYNIKTHKIFNYKGEDKNCTFEFKTMSDKYFTKWMIRTNYTDKEVGDWDINDHFFEIEKSKNKPEDPYTMIQNKLFDKVKNLNDVEIEKLDGNKKIIDTKIGLPLNLTTTEINEEIKKCYIITRQSNKELEINEVDLQITWKLFDIKYSDKLKSCSLYTKNINKRDFGVLTVITYYHDSKKNESKFIWHVFRIQEVEEIQAYPSFLITKNSGNKEKIKIPRDFEAHEICTIYHEKKKIKSYTPEERFDENKYIKNCEIQDVCCFEIELNSNTTGDWLIEKRSDFFITRAPFKLRVIEINSKNNHYKLWKKNSREKIVMDSYEGFNCKLHRLYDSEILFDSSDCLYSIEKVSMSHAGKYVAQYYVGHPWNYIEEEYTIEIQDDDNNITVGVNETERSINILCKGSINEDIQKCLFKQLNETIVTFPSAEKNEKYEFFGGRWKNESIDKNFGCGLTINNPISDDYKKWICILDYGGERVYSTEVFIGKNKRKIEIIEANCEDDDDEDKNKCINIKFGDKFEVTCNSDDEKINYCQIESPTLERYYNNSKNGHCGVIIENANYNHSGNWNCIYQFDKKFKVKKIIPVFVREEEVTAGITKISESSADKKLSTLTCEVYPVGEKIKTCQWEHPNGKKISNDGYKIFKENCTIQFEYAEENNGVWKCIVEFDNFPDKYEANLNFIVNKNSRETEKINKKEQKLQILTFVCVFFGLLLFLLLVLVFVYHHNSKDCPLLTRTNEINDEDL